MKETKKFLKNNITENETIVIGVSGGPDSMVLLTLISELRDEKSFNIVCAHVNHNVRKESEEEKEFMEQFCNTNNIIFEYLKIEEYSDDNFHNQARIIRYDFFEKVLTKHNSKKLFTGHHGDDLIETILMRIVRGSTLKGYSGFSKVYQKENYTILRPLIYQTKEQITEYAKTQKIEYRVDKSNFKEVYTRNRYRQNILPFLKKEDPKVNMKFLKFSEKLNRMNEYIDEIMLKNIDMVYKDKTIIIEEFNKLDDIIKERVINYILEDIYDDDLILINDQHTNLILDMIKNIKPNLSIYLPSGLQAIKSYGKVKIYNVLMQEDYNFELKDSNNLINGKNIKKIADTEIDNNNICRLNSSDLKLPLRIRNRRPGDKMTIKGMIGTKKIKDIFIDQKISYEDRNTWPILVDNEGTILWLPGLKKSKFNVNKNKKCDIILKYD